MHSLSKLIVLILVSVCYGCAPSGSESDNVSSSNQPSSSDVVSSTHSLVASSDFDFKSDRSIALSFEDFPSANGKFVIYSQFEHYDALTQVYYPDYSTRLASFIASPDLVYELMIPTAQQFLVLEWLPMDGLSHERYQLLALNDQNSYRASF